MSDASNPSRGIDTLIRAISLMDRRGILQECPHYLAVIGGDPEESQNELSAEMQRLQALAFELKVDDLVIFMGKRSQETLPYYYSAAQMVMFLRFTNPLAWLRWRQWLAVRRWSPRMSVDWCISSRMA